MLKINIRSSVPLFVALINGLLLNGCSTASRQAGRVSGQAGRLLVEARGHYRDARRHPLQPSVAAACYIEAAEAAWQARMDAGQEAAARSVYNDSTAELTALLRAGDGGHLWKSPVTVSADGKTFLLRLASATGRDAWMNGYFTSFIPAKNVNERYFRIRVKQEGIGGALVGFRRTDPRQPFMPAPGFVAPVTATLSFHGQDASLSLNDTTVHGSVSINGSTQPLAADFTATVAVLPRRNELWAGLMGLIDVQGYLSKCGLYMVQPYDPNKIPVIFVHGLISTPQMWFNVVNELATDPELRAHYQFWGFYYPTGNPVLYSALRFRDELSKMERLHPRTDNIVLVGHSMGGLVSRLQSTNTGRVIWNQVFGQKADQLYKKLPPDNLVKRGVIFNANPDVKRLIFICVPHRGSELAMNSIGAIGSWLVRMPSSLMKSFTDALGGALTTIEGMPRIPTGIHGLSPKSPTLIALEKLPVQAPYNSIIGDRGRGDTPNSSDGVVPYWSSHLDGAQSELIVPGPHGSCELPQTVEELKRILRLHLKDK